MRRDRPNWPKAGQIGSSSSQVDSCCAKGRRHAGQPSSVEIALRISSSFAWSISPWSSQGKTRSDSIGLARIWPNYCRCWMLANAGLVLVDFATYFAIFGPVPANIGPSSIELDLIRQPVDQGSTRIERVRKIGARFRKKSACIRRSCAGFVPERVLAAASRPAPTHLRRDEGVWPYPQNRT